MLQIICGEIVNMDKINFGASETLIFAGAAIIFAGHFTAGVVFCSIGIVAACVRYSLRYQLEREDLESRQKIYEDIKAAAAGGVQGVQNVLNEGKNWFH